MAVKSDFGKNVHQKNVVLQSKVVVFLHSQLSAVDSNAEPRVPGERLRIQLQLFIVTACD